MLSLSKFFDHPNLVAFTSDSSVDFTLDEAAPFLTDRQRSALTQAVGASFGSLAWVKQVHGAGVIAVDQEFINDSVLREADALVTDKKDVLVAVRTADCLPVFIWDPVNEAMGVVHAGWKSTHKEIVLKTCEIMAARYKSDYKNLSIAFGPSIRSCCYEVSTEFRNHFPGAVTERGGQLFMDLIKANRDQLTSLGIHRDQIFDSRVCTVCTPGYFSYRRDGAKAGRMISGLLLNGQTHGN
jgi:YfiH family protein